MKKRIITLPALALVLAVFSAFAFKPTSTGNSNKLPSYYWFNTSNVYHDLQTKADEQNITNCKVTAVLCENAYNQNQLVNPNDPSQGVKTGQMPVDHISKP